MVENSSYKNRGIKFPRGLVVKTVWPLGLSDVFVLKTFLMFHE